MREKAFRNILVAKGNLLEELESGMLIELLEEFSFKRETYIYYERIKFVEPKVRKLIDFFFEN